MTAATETAAPDFATAVDMLRRFIAQRSGIDRRNYQRDYRDRDGYAAFSSDYRGILRDGRDARRMLEFIASRQGITAADILAAKSGNGRLEFVRGDDGRYRLDYTAGQYFAVEYRDAACGLLAGIIRRYFAECGYTREQILREVRGVFGRGIAGRWF